MPARPRRGADSLEQGLDRLVSAGRQLVDGVAGARPGSRGPAGARPRLADLGRWVEDKLDWILEEEDDWREPWQEEQRPVRGPESRWEAGRWGEERPPAVRSPDVAAPPRSRPLQPRQPVVMEPEPSRPEPRAATAPAAVGRGARQPLQAISRRHPGAVAPVSPVAGPGNDWPDDDAFTRSRWQRPLDAPGRSPESRAASTSGQQPRPAPVLPLDSDPITRGPERTVERPGAGPAASPGVTPEPRLGGARPLPRSSRRRSG
jgi:hypothetical protein